MSGSTFAHVEVRRRCAHCRAPSNRCPCKHCGSCSTSGGERCACGTLGPSHVAGGHVAGEAPPESEARP